MGDLECTACGGTHCNNTGEIQLVKLLGTEPIRKRTMVKFIAGAQALCDYQQRYEITNGLTRQLTCGLDDLPERYDKIAADKTTLTRELTAANKELLPIRADLLIEQQHVIAGSSLIVASIKSDQIALGAQLATTVTAKTEGIALLLCEDRLFLSVSDSSDLKAGQLMRQLAETTGIKGGGNKQLAQGGNASLEKLPLYLDLMKKLVANV